MQDFLRDDNNETSAANETTNNNLPMPSCDQCRMKCSTRMTEQERSIINRSFWNLKKCVEKRYFINSHVIRKQVARRTGTNDSKRMNVFHYQLPKENGENVLVCRSFFLTTLGFKPSNTRALRFTLLNHNPITLESPADNRGKRDKGAILNREEKIRLHVESYHPYISHYRRSHAPNRRYLSSEITIKKMVDDFVKKHPEYKSPSIYEMYRSVVNDMNISFAKLGNEECETCEQFEQHNPSHNKTNLCSSCQVCSDWLCHKEISEQARSL